MKPIVSRITVEVLGAPQHYVDETLQKVLSKFKEEEEVQILSTQVFESKQMDNKLFSTFADIEFKVPSFKRVLEVCYDYTPSSIEILEPAGMEIDCNDMADFLNDFLARIHKYSMGLKKLQAENILMKRKLG